MKGKNIGEIIKKVAVIYGAITVLGCFIAAIVCYSKAAAITYSYSSEKAVFTLWGNILMFGGIIPNAIFAMLMYGYGELIVLVKSIALNNAKEEKSSNDNISNELPEI